MSIISSNFSYAATPTSVSQYKDLLTKFTHKTLSKNTGVAEINSFGFLYSQDLEEQQSSSLINVIVEHPDLTRAETIQRFSSNFLYFPLNPSYFLLLPSQYVITT